MTIANNREPAKLTVHRSTDRIKLKPKRWSHQDELASLKGQKITFILVGADHALTARLLEADQFTLKVQLDNVTLHGQSVVTYQKSSIMCWGAAK